MHRSPGSLQSTPLVRERNGIRALPRDKFAGELPRDKFAGDTLLSASACINTRAGAPSPSDSPVCKWLCGFNGILPFLSERWELVVLFRLSTGDTASASVLCEPVSLAWPKMLRKHLFCMARKKDRSAPLCGSISLPETIRSTISHGFGGFSRQSLGNAGFVQTAWWAREDSNLQPDRYERSALTVELRARAPARVATRLPL